MKFKVNGEDWTIKEVDEATINNEMKDNNTLGVTFFRKHEIWLANNNIDKIRTLKHELMHVWLWEYGHNQDEKEFNSEDICEIVASSNDFINEVVRQYLRIKKPLYLCDAKNNIECKKKSCYINGGVCHKTTKIKYAKNVNENINR